jgi:hypothetical protein
VALSTKEKYLALAVGAAVALAAIDRLVIDPFSQTSREIASKRFDIDAKLAKADSTFHRKLMLRHVWDDMNNTNIGGLKTDSSEAKSQMIQSLQNWAQASGVTVTSLTSKDASQGAVDLKADKPESKFERIGVHAAGYGTMAAMTKLLWKVETSPKLLKVTEIHITPRKEATDDLQIELTVATVSLIPDASPADNATDSRPDASAGMGLQPCAQK